jgi:threonine/homoserine efflux transporter RhtA
LDELERAVDTQLQLPVSQLAADRPEASTVAALLLLVPAVTSIASAATLGETLHPATLVGMVVAIVGVGTVLRREAPRSRRIWRANRCPVG